MKLRYKLGLVIVTLGMALCLMTYQSYALWVKSDHGTENVITVGCFNIDMKELEGNPTIKLTNTYPTTDTKGLNQTPFKFTITNTCDVNSAYYVTLNTLTSNEIAGYTNDELQETFEGFNLKDKIKFVILEDDEPLPETGTNLGEYSKDPKNINADTKNLSVTNLAESIILKTGTLAKDETRTFSLYLWYDGETAGNEVMNQHFEASINIINKATLPAEIANILFPGVVPDELDDAGNGLGIYEIDTKDEELTNAGWVNMEARYVGPNPDNYVRFNNELWRIIGLVNVKKSDGSIVQRLKIIKAESIGKYQWNTNHTNEWSQSSLMQYLNTNYYNEKLTDSISRSMIDENIIWNFGGVTSKYTKMADWYINERKNGALHQRSAEWSASNTLEDTPFHSIGLMYPSDYAMSNYKNGSWLLPTASNEYWWTITPYLTCNGQPGTECICYLGKIQGITYDNVLSNNLFQVFPTVYLKQEVEVRHGHGKTDDPFILSFQ